MVISIVIVLVVLGGFYLMLGGQKEVVEEVPIVDEEVAEEIEELPEEIPETAPSTHTVEITSSGFSPKNLEIKQGDTVVFVNKDDSTQWPASDVHPTHKSYPGSGISKCGTSEEQNIFDACKGLEQDESYSFTFNEEGSWNYHNHFSPGLKGTIVVS